MQPKTEATSTTLEQVEHRENLARAVLRSIRQHYISEPRPGPTFTIAQAAELVGRTSSAIRMAETEGRLPPQPRNSLGRRENYTLLQLNHMRDVFDTRPWRHPSDDAVVLPVQNFKGGVGKSTIALHLAQYLAIRGYRVLLVDADAQASTTMMFGYIPDDDFGPDDNLFACLNPAAEYYRPLKELIRSTHYDGLDLIPANLNLYNAEYDIAARMPTFGPRILTMLRQELATVSDSYDMIILDPPPALGMVSMSVLYAANALMIPMPPNVVDFASTTSFLSMLAENMRGLGAKGLTAEYGFIQIVLSRSDESKWAQGQIIELCKTVFGDGIMTTEVKNSAEIDNCTAKQQSVYDLSAVSTNHHVRRRCLKQLNDLNSEVETHIRSLWRNTAPHPKGRLADSVSVTP